MLFVIVILAILGGLAAAGWNAYVLSVLWSWFIVPTFHVGPIGWQVAYGMVLVASAVRGFPDTARPEQRDESARTAGTKLVVRVILTPLLALLLGWLLKP